VTFLSLLAFIGMDAVEKIFFAFSAFDFDSRGSLSSDETTLLFRSIAKGLGKSSPSTHAFIAVSRDDAERYASLVFNNNADNVNQAGGRINIEALKNYCVSHPILSNWLKALSFLSTEEEKIIEKEEDKTPKAIENHRNEWLLPLLSSFPGQPKYSTHKRMLELKEIEIELNDKDSVSPNNDSISLNTETNNNQNSGNNKHYYKIDDHNWISRIEKLKPEEIPPVRTDLPENDLFETIWISGINVRRRILDDNTGGGFSNSRIHRNARYLSSDMILYSTSNYLIVLKKNEESQQWQQTLYNEHNYPISAFDINYEKNILVTVDSSITHFKKELNSNSNNSKRENNRFVIWDISNPLNLSVKKIIEFPTSIKFLDISTNGNLALIVLEDLGNTLHVYDLSTGLCLFSKKLLFSSLKDNVNDVRFFGTSTMIAVATQKLGMTFYVDEEGSLLGKNNMKCYEERSSLYGKLGKEIKGTSFTELTRLETIDEIATGNNKGQIIIWHGRTINQVIDGAHDKTTSITALDYNKATKTLISGASDGTIRIFDLIDNNAIVSNGSTKGPKVPKTRCFTLSASFDIIGVKDLSGYSIASVILSSDSSKALVTTSTNDLVEVRCKVRQPTAEELQEAAAAGGAEGGEEGGIPSNLGKLGDDLNNGPLVTSHFLNDAIVGGSSSIITSLTRYNNNSSFISCGNDGTIRLWQPVGGAEGGGDPTYKIGKSIKMDAGCTAITASSVSFAVALNGIGENPARAGTIHLFSLPEGNFLSEIPSTGSKKDIRELRMNNEGSLLIVNSYDNTLSVYTQTEGAWSLKGKLPMEGSDVIACDRFDLSSDNQFLRCYYSSIKNIRIYDLVTTFGKELFSAAEEALATAKPPETTEEAMINPAVAIYEPIRAITWSTNYCPYNWDVAGSPLFVSPSSSASSSLYDRSNSLLVGSTIDGSVEVTRAPCYFKGSIPKGTFSKSLSSQHIGGRISGMLFFDEGGVKLVSCGSFDGIIRVMKVTYDTDEPEPELPDAKLDEGDVIAGGDAGEEGEEGKPTLPPVSDSGDEEDYYDIEKCKEHIPKVTVGAGGIVGMPSITLPPIGGNVEEGEGEQANNNNGNGVNSLDFENLMRDGPVLSKYTKILAFENAMDLSKMAMKSLSNSGPGNKQLSVSSLIPATDVPKEDLSVNWVYGCTVRSTRNTVRYTNNSLIIYPAGCMTVIYDKVTKKQVLTTPHRDVISCLDIHLGKNIGATSHIGVGSIYIHLWKISDGSLLRIIDAGAVNGISSLKFSPDGHFLIVAAQDNDHTVSMYQVDDGALLSSVSSGKNKILCFAFSDVTTSNGNILRICQGGIKHYKLLSYNIAQRCFQSKNGIYGAEIRKSNILAISSLPMAVSSEGGAENVSGNEFLLATSDGNLGFIARGEMKVGGFSPVTKGPITALTVARMKPATSEEPPSYKVIIGGILGAIKVLDQELQPLQEYNLYLKEYGLIPMGRAKGFKSLCVDKANRKILYGTSGNEIGEIDLTNGDDLNNFLPVIQGHYRDSLNTLCSHPLRQEALTAGSDKTLRVWDLDSHSLITQIELPDKAIAGCFAPNGHLILVSLSRKFDDPFGGRMVVISYLQKKSRIVYMSQDAKEEITSIIFSPDGSKVYVGSLDRIIYIYDALNNFQLLGQLPGHNEGIRSLDISSNGQFLVSESILNDIKIWDLNTKSVVQRSSDMYETLHDIGLSYYKRGNRFGLNSIGIFPLPSSSTSSSIASVEEVTSLHQSNSHSLLLVGSSLGSLKLFSNPAIQLNSPFKNYYLHSPGGIAGVQFSSDDKYALSIGKHDKVLIQWKVSSIPTAAISSPRGASEETKGGGGNENNEGIAAITTKKVPNKDQKPENLPDDIYENSFVVRNLNFIDNLNSTQTWSSLPSSTIGQLASITGVGNSSSLSQYDSSLSYPKLAFCGSGELLSVFGKNVTITEGGSNASTYRIWNRSNLFPVGSNNQPASFEVSSIAVSPNGRYVAIGYLSTDILENNSSSKSGGNHPLHLYSAPNGEFLNELSPHIANGVTAMSFSNNSKILGVIGRDSDHTLYVYSTYSSYWNDCFLLYSTHINTLPVSFISFLSLHTSGLDALGGIASKKKGGQEIAEEDREEIVARETARVQERKERGDYIDFHFVTGGKGSLQFWKILNNTNVITEIATYDSSISSEKEITALVGLRASSNLLNANPYFPNNWGGYVMTGDIEGNLLVWKNPKDYYLIRNYQTPIQSLIAYGSVDELKGSGNSGVIVATSSMIHTYSTSTSPSDIMINHSFDLETFFSQLPTSSIYKNPLIMNSSLKVGSVTSDIDCREIVVGLNNGVVLSVSVDSGDAKVLFEGHGMNNSEIIQMITHPVDPASSSLSTSIGSSSSQLIGTISTDHTIRIFRLSSQKDNVTSGISLKTSSPGAAISDAAEEQLGLIAYYTLDHLPTAALFANDHILLVAIPDTDRGGNSSAILIIDIQKYNPASNTVSTTGEYTFTILHKLHNIGNGKITSLQFSSNKKHFGASSTDGNVYLWGVVSAKNDDVAAVIPDVGQFFSLGYLLAHPNGNAVIGFDFAETKPATRYIRTFGENYAKWNGKVDVNYFDLETVPGASGNAGEGEESNTRKSTIAKGSEWRRHAGSKIQDVQILEEVIKPLKWSSIASPAAPEVRGLSVTKDSKQPILHVESVSVSPDNKLVVAGYNNGVVRIFK
jgi:WD40 repeat protein